MNIRLWVAAAIGLCSSSTADAQLLRLDTGYDYAASGLYQSPTAQDDYWIKIASYEPVANPVSVDRAWIYYSGWLSAPARWLGPRPLGSSTSGTSASRKAYSIYRKCFCLLSTENASINFRLRGDDIVQAWLNSVRNTLVGPTIGNYSGGAALPSLPSNVGMFRRGRNCLYVLVEDWWGATAFTLDGQVTAPGVFPVAARGLEASFEPCRCPESDDAVDARDAMERIMVRDLVRLADMRSRLGTLGERPALTGQQAPFARTPVSALSSLEPAGAGSGPAVPRLARTR